MNGSAWRLWSARIVTLVGAVFSLATPAPPVNCTDENLYQLETFRDVGPIAEGDANLTRLFLVSNYGCPQLVLSGAYTELACPLLDSSSSAAGATGHPLLPTENASSEECIVGVGRELCVQLTDPGTPNRIVAQVQACDAKAMTERAYWIQLDVR